MRSGRHCQLLDGTFRHHEFSSTTLARSREQSEAVRNSPSPHITNIAANDTDNNERPPSGVAATEASVNLLGNPDPVPDTTSHHGTQASVTPGMTILGFPTDELPPHAPSIDANANLLSPGLATTTSIGTHTIPKGIPAHAEESFFLRIFCEGPGKWLVILSLHSQISQG